MRSRHAKRDAIVIAVMTLVVAALAASATSAKAYDNGFKLAKFRVEVKGTQTTVEQRHHAPENECDVSDFSSGTETVTFRTIRPVTISATYSPGFESPLFFTGKKTLGIPTKAKVKRKWTTRAHGPAVPCEDNGGGVVTTGPELPDCGTKTVTPYVVELEYADSKSGQLTVTGDSGAEQPFLTCSGGMFPFLLVEKGYASNSPVVHADLPQSDLFNPKFKKWISLANDSYKTRGSDYWSNTEIQWDVSFTRLGK